MFRPHLSRLILLSLCAALPCLASRVACAQQTPVTALGALPGGAGLTAPSVSLLLDTPLEVFRISGRDAGKGRINIVPATHPEFKTAIRAQTLEAVQQPYNLQLAARTTAPIAKGDVLFVSFWARMVEAPMGEAFVGFTFEQAVAPFQRSMGMENSVGREWKQFTFPFKSAADYAPGEAVVNLRLSYLPQIVEIGGVMARDYAQNTSVESLPGMKITYAGREDDAPWRQAANERIDKIRKAPLRVVVKDKNGQPMPGVQVNIEQTHNAFAFGSAVSAKALISTDPADVEYQNRVKSLFNKVVFENDLKWARWEGDRATPLQAIAWLHANHIDVRGHTLVWPSWRHLPPDIEKLKNDPVALQKRINDHVTEEATALRGQVVEWDVMNEPFANHDVMDLAGPQVQSEWYRLAHQADPNAKLYLNDYNILEVGGRDTEHQKHFEDTITYLLVQNAPLDGIGIQGHFGSNLTPPAKLLEILDRFAKFGKPIQITEFDVQVSDEKLQADYTRDFLTAMFSHPNVNGVVMWGFWEGLHYAPGAALWRKDWSPKPNGQAWLDLVQKQWRTNEKGATDATGSFERRAFLGNYNVTATIDGKPVTVATSLHKAGNTLTITSP